ncbi:MAG: NAD(+) diphosphatase [Gammaproteobacteria bacterium]|nr:NAD(+) diphosphatase [Gammaproteobacteria bacterium]
MGYGAEVANHFAGPWLDRASRLRQDPAWLTAALAAEDTLFVPVHAERCLVASLEAPRARFLTRTQLAALDADIDVEDAVFLGLHETRAVFALALPQSPDTLEGEFVDLWQVGQRLAPVEAAILAYAKAMVGWRSRHRYCSETGEPLAATAGGHVLAAPDGRRLFPRVDPAIIVLVSDGDRCLLGRQAKWPPGRYSTIAGFVEPGESLEDAVAREVEEETDVRIRDPRYHSSQPWPFPSSLMLGFHAEAASTAIHLNDGELADARWFSRAEIAEGEVRLPPALSISRRLIATWFDRWDGPSLVTLLGAHASR